uniref:Uncharacterized protein n=1 Tax=Acrobeloides nanus TaxID=290746 RepID=A0A914DSK2_9BILA
MLDFSEWNESISSSSAGFGIWNWKMLDLSTRLAKAQFATFLLTAASQFFAFIALITPAWQVADDNDTGQEMQSGLWMYCPGSNQQCWYIFSDDFMNYYEKVKVCRFFLIGDCRIKLLRTPYFFGWHYAVLIIMIITLLLMTATLITIAIAYYRSRWNRIATIVMDVFLFMAFLTICIGLAVFMINAEMLESKYLIGVRNTFEKSYGYSFYLAGLSWTILLFAAMAAIICTTYLFFIRENDFVEPGEFDQASDFVMQSDKARQYQMMHEIPQSQNYPGSLDPRYPGYAPRY